MPTRNTPVLATIVESLGALAIGPADVLARLEQNFESKLLVVACDAEIVAKSAEELRLSITPTERAAVLDYIAPHPPPLIEQVEDAINTLFPDRFIEP